MLTRSLPTAVLAAVAPVTIASAQAKPVFVDGQERRLAIQVDAHAIPESDEPFLAFLLELEQAYKAADPKLCTFVGID